MRLTPLLRALLQRDRGRLAWAFVLQVVAALTQGVGLLVLVPLLEIAGVTGGDADRSFLGVEFTLRGALAFYVLAISLVAVLTAYQTVVLTRYRLNFVDQLRLRLYTALAEADWRHVLSYRHSDLLSALTQNIAMVTQGVHAALQVSVTAVVVVVQVAVAVRISPAVTLLAAATGLALAAVVWPLVRRSRDLGRAFVDNNLAVMGATTGFLDGLKLAKGHNRTQWHVDEFDRTIARTRQSQLDFTWASALATAAQLITTACVLAVLVAVAVERLRLPIAELLVVVFIFSRVVPQITRAQQQLQLTAQALPALDELLALVADCEAAREPDAGTAAPARLPLGAGLRFEDVSFVYPTAAAPAVRGVSLTIAARHTTAIVGPSGAGKTTLADLAVGLLQPTEGRIVVGTEPLTPSNSAAWRESVGLSPQDAFLFHDTIRANLAWARTDATEQDMWAALDTAAASAVVRARPEGLDAVVGDRGMRLSGGERQRIAVARALLRQPELLVLDEATSSLDTEHERAIRDALVALHGEVTILIIAHRLSTVSHADTIVVLDNGEVVESGPWAELADRAGGRLQSLIAAGALS